jgi:hypothetical protein
LIQKNMISCRQWVEHFCDFLFYRRWAWQLNGAHAENTVQPQMSQSTQSNSDLCFYLRPLRHLRLIPFIPLTEVGLVSPRVGKAVRS